ncbi:MAG: lipopolysaccharide biosynthesis protein [Sulfurimonadaceae bacterium]
MKKAFYNGIFVTLISIGLNFFFKIIAAHLIEKSELTLYFTAIDIFTLTLLVLVGFRSSMVVTFAQLKNPQMIINVFRGVIVVTVLLVWGLVIPFLKHKIGVDIHYWYLVATVLSLSIALYFSNIIAMYRLYNIINSVTLLEPLLVLFWFALAFFAFDLRGIQPLFIATIMSSFGISMFVFAMSKKYYGSVVIKRPEFDTKAIKFIKNSVISTIEFGSGIVLLYMVVFLMLKHFSVDELGDFQVVTKPIFTYMMMLFVFPIFRFVLPELSKLISEKNMSEIKALKRWIYRYAFIVSGVFLLVALLFSSQIIELLFPPEYVGASLMLKHLAFFFIFLIVNAYQIAFIKASGAFMSALLIRLLGIVILVATFYAIYLFFSQSVISLIIALVFSYVGMFSVSFLLERKIFKELEKENP